MTIRLPGIMDELGPSLQGITDLVKFGVNHDYKNQENLKAAMLANPALAQQLIDMGPDQVEQVYGRGTGKIAPTGPISVKKQTENAARSAISDMLARPDDDPLKVQWRADTIGAKTPQEMELKAQQLLAAKQGVQSGAMTLQDQQRKQADREEGDTALRNAHAAVGIDPLQVDTYNAVKQGKYGQVPLASLLKNEEFKLKYENDRQENYRRQELEIRQQMADKALRGAPFDINEYLEKVAANKAGMLAEAAGVDGRAVFNLLKTPSLYDKYTAVGFKPNEKDPADMNTYRAAMAIKDQNEKAGDAEQFKKARELRLATADDKKIAESLKGSVSDFDRKAAVQRMNDKAREIFGKDAPEYAYDTKGPTSEEHWYGDKPTLYQKGGDPGVFGGEVGYVPKPVGTPSAIPDVEKIAGLIAQGKANLNEQLSFASGGPNGAIGKELKRRTAELMGSKGLTVELPSVLGDTTSAKPQVAQALSLPSPSTTAPVDFRGGDTTSVKAPAANPNQFGVAQPRPAGSTEIVLDKKAFQGLSNKEQGKYIAEATTKILQGVLSGNLDAPTENDVVGYLSKKGILPKNSRFTDSAEINPATIAALDSMSKAQLRIVADKIREAGATIAPIAADPTVALGDYYRKRGNK